MSSTTITEEDTRFDGCRRLFGEDVLSDLAECHVAIVGLGGVGSWCVESVVRSGAGRLSLVDLDEVCVSNCNRQICALTSTVGKTKAEVLAKRCKDVNPRVTVETVLDFVDESNVVELLKLDSEEDCPDVVVDAIDSARDKASIIRECAARGVSIVSVGGSGGRTDPTKVRMRQGLAHVGGDPLLRAVRRLLDPEIRTLPVSIYSDEKASPAPRDSLKMTGCDQGFGTASFVTGAFGLAAAKAVVDAVGRRRRMRESEGGSMRRVRATDVEEEDFIEEDCPCSDFAGC